MRLPGQVKKLKFMHQVVREDRPSAYGFRSEDEKKPF